MVKKKFENELTFDKLKALGAEEKFHAAYDSAYEASLTHLGTSHPNIVAGKERTSEAGEFPDLCPYNTGLIIGKFQKGSRKDVADAVRISGEAFDSWEMTKVKSRCEIFLKAASAMSKEKYDLAATITLENGKNRFEAMAEVDEAIDYLRYYPRVLTEHEGYVLEMDGPVPCNQARSILRPLGPVGVISPFNFPLAITAGMCAGALITGNPVVLKPPSDAPMVGIMLHRIMLESGIPPEVFHVITGPGDTVGSELISNPGISAVAFTGSREIGLAVMKGSLERGRRPPIVEMGGKNAVIVSDKADLARAVEGVCRGAFGYSGQKCSATSRVIVNRTVADKFLSGLVSWIGGIHIGDPSRREVFTGPVISRAAVERFSKVIMTASRDGKVLAGGHVLTGGSYSNGYFVEPTVVVHLSRDHELAMKELFLPVLVVQTYGELNEAIGLANSTEYGLTGGIFSDDPSEVDEFFDKMRAGVLYANRTTGATTGALVGQQPFVGWKSSGVTGKGAGGPYYLQQFLQEQSRTLCR